MIRKIVLAGAAAALIATPALAGSHGGGKKMMKMDCAAKLQKMEKKGMTGGQNAELYNKAKELMKAGDEKGCMQMVYKMKKAMKGGKGYGKY